MSEPLLPARRALLGAGVAALTAGVGGCAATTSTRSATTSASGSGSASASASGSASGAASGSASPATSGAGPVEPSIARTPGDDISHGPTTRGEVALTFHGQGDAAINGQIREALDRAGARATIFAVGTWVVGDPQQVRAFAASGHEVGNHTWSHLDLPSVDEATALREIQRGRDALAQVLGAPGWWFRPSATKLSTPTIRAAAASAGYARCVSYDVDPEDFREPGAALVRERVRSTVTAGSIVSLHLGHAGTAAALPGILDDLSARGLRPVTLSTLLRD